MLELYVLFLQLFCKLKIFPKKVKVWLYKKIKSLFKKPMESIQIEMTVFNMQTQKDKDNKSPLGK